jgi:hypothetical protein
MALVTAQPAGGRPAKRSLFETAQMIAFELAILKLRQRFGGTSETICAPRTNSG